MGHIHTSLANQIAHILRANDNFLLLRYSYYKKKVTEQALVLFGVLFEQSLKELKSQ